MLLKEETAHTFDLLLTYLTIIVLTALMQAALILTPHVFPSMFNHPTAELAKVKKKKKKKKEKHTVLSVI